MHKVLRFVRNQLLISAGMTVLGYVAYQVLLDDEAKAGVRSLIDTIAQSAELLNNQVTNRIGIIMDEEVIRENRQQVREAWEQLGF